MRKSLSPSFWGAFLICTVATLIPLWSYKYLPMVDLPHHAAQVAILRHFSDPAFGFSGQFIINWFTPYAFAYYVALLFAFIFPIGIAMKIVVTLTAVALPLSLLFLLNQTGGDPWWSLAGFSATFGLNFLWGLFNYSFAVPIGIFCIGMALKYAYMPTQKNALILFFLSLLVFFSHGVVYAVCFGLNTWIVFSYPSRLTPPIRRYLPIWLTSIIVIIWYLMPAKGVPRVDSFIQWDNLGWQRLLEIPGTIISVSGDKQAEQIGYILLVALFIGGTPVWQTKRFLAFLATVVLFQFSPFHFLGHSFIYPRLAIFIVAGFYLWLRQAQHPWRRLLSRVMIVGLVITWSGITTMRFRGFNQEAREYDEVMKNTLPRRSVLGLVFNRDSAYVPAQQFYHFPVWYQAEKGGQIGYSIAYLYNVIARYKPGSEPLSFNLSSSVCTNPATMNWQQYGNFDYYVVRSISGLPKGLFDDSHGAAVLESHAGNWWLFKNKEKFS